MIALDLFCYSTFLFGVHIMRTSLSVFAVYLIDSSFITPGKYALLMNAAFLPAVILPPIVGALLDNMGTLHERNLYTLMFLLINLFGQLVFCYAVSIKSFEAALCGQIIFGVGACSTVAVQRAIINVKFKGRETLVTGSYVAFGAIGRMIGQAFAVPLAVWCGSYVTAIFLSSLSGLVPVSVVLLMLWAPSELLSDIQLDSSFNDVTYDKEARICSKSEMLSTPSQLSSNKESVLFQTPYHSTSSYQSEDNSEGIALIQNGNTAHSTSTNEVNSPLIQSILFRRLIAVGFRFRTVMSQLPRIFWLLAIIHSIFLAVFHSLPNFLPHYLKTTFHEDIAEAGKNASLMSSLVVLVSPIAGLLVDRSGNHVLICLISAGISSAGLFCLTFHIFQPIVSMLLLSMGFSLIPLVSLACVALSVPSRYSGTAFGILEITDGTLYVISNMTIGMIYDATGNYQISILYILCLSLIGFLGLFVIECFELNSIKVIVSEGIELTKDSKFQSALVISEE